MKIKDLLKIERPIKKHIGTGHRKRLRDKFLQSGLGSFLDYEIVELLLTLGTPMKDCKQMAKMAVKSFGGLRGVLDASLDDLQKIKGIGSSNAFGIKLFQAVSERLAKEHISDKILLDSTKAVADFLQKSIGREKKEHFVLLSLDTHNCLIKIIDISVGSLDASIVHPREVFKEAVQSSSALIIIAHNHPSGDTEPSENDIDLTNTLVEAGEIMGIEVVDHIIVTSSSYLSFKERGLIN